MKGWLPLPEATRSGSVASTASPAAPAIPEGVAPLRAGEGRSFLLRRLHSLSGIIPVGAFLFEHAWRCTVQPRQPFAKRHPFVVTVDD